MEASAIEGESDIPVPVRRRWSRRAWILALVLGLIVAVIAGAWFSRERIAGNVIAGQIEAMDLPATYRIVSIGTRRQVLADIVIGDPARPDLTIERAEVEIVPRFGVPGIGRIYFVKPRLYGSYRSGKLSFGSLDPMLFDGDGQAPFRLPALDVAIEDGRGLLETDHGAVGLKVEGAGGLRNGFSGVLAAVVPDGRAGDCRARRTSLYGTLRIVSEQPRFLGPLRMAALDCGKNVSLVDAAVQIDATIDRNFGGGTARLDLRAARLTSGANRLLAPAGTARIVSHKGLLTAHYDLRSGAVETPQARFATAELAGSIRGSDGLKRLDAEGTIAGRDMRTGPALDSALAGVIATGKGTLVAPLAGQLRTALLRETPGSTLDLAFMVRSTPGTSSVIVPQASLRSKSGATLVSVSRMQAAFEGTSLPRIAGNFSTGGPGLPRIAGRMERSGTGALVMRLAMADYRAGTSAMAIPRLSLVQDRGGIGFAGEVRVSGEFPGGRAENLIAPIDGNWSNRGGIALWRRCLPVRFDSLRLSSLTLDRRALTLCPATGGAIVRSGPAGLRIAAGAPALAVIGTLGSTPIRIASGPIGFAVPGNLAAQSLDVALGPAATASRFRISHLSARIGKDIAGRFSGTDVLLAAVPLDMRDASGNWRFANGRLGLTDAAFRLEDRAVDDRFQPLAAQGATLSLVDNRIAADAVLREPASGREVVRAVIEHNLASGRGGADLLVDSLLLDDRVQPDTLTRLALGVVANVEGTVRGTGRIDWNPEQVTSTGRFTTGKLDFAAAFGPVQGLSGTVEFTDLLGLVTAPDQSLRIAAINPGIEVNDGTVVFELRPNAQIAVKDGTWPFFGGTLRLQPTTLTMGVAETRRYALVIEGLDAAKLAQRMNLANITISGTFDGILPLVFDENGGTIVDGALQSRKPGGNLSYVGELTYKDLSPMANFAFETLRSLDYTTMRVEMEGRLAGEIITRLKFDGVRQGDGAKRNFLTERIGRLPIRFNVNIRAPFFQLVTSLRSMYDPAYVRDPRSLGLIDEQGRPLPPTAVPGVIPPVPIISDIQPPESGTAP